MQAWQFHRNLKARLEATLGPDRVRKYPATCTNGAVSQGHLDTLCDNLLADLTAVIQAEIAKFSASDSPTPKSPPTSSSVSFVAGKIGSKAGRTCCGA